MPQLPRVAGAHLVGSVNQPTAEAVFRLAAGELGAALPRIPDGEVGERFHWILFQGAAFDRVAGLVRAPIDPIVVAGFDLRPLLLDGTVPAAELVFGPLGYAAAAVESHAEFVRLREADVIPAGTRFQVCLPSPLAPVTSFVAPADRAAVYPAYAAALVAELRAIAAAIPAEDLAVQLDLATEFAYLEGISLGGGPLEAFFAAAEGADADALAAEVAQLVAGLADAVPAGAELGFHLCYGDVGEKHFVEPQDAGRLVAVANALGTAVARRIDWVHLPVPIERTDAAYAAPLAGWALPAATTPFLGLVHHEDGVDGALARLVPAREALAAAGVAEFGIGTECGFGRGPAERTAGLLALHREILAAAQ
ncbi:hypothetical protein [Agromyces soli]|uniref:Methionine synthase n=1 Tax=Agromyces soli TaxID=659012 RepID=A0ABY4AX33_9MICO|nr:hypothetical protein [Agromyces soli]UOE27733.1 hypothetical protein MTP13_08135 [Agromyces soli]